MCNNPFIQECQFAKNELPIASRIQQLRLMMLIHSRLYYNLNRNVLSDKDFDKFGKELKQLQEDNPSISSKICYADVFKDWDGTTGAFLPLEDEWVIKKTNQLYGNRKERKRK